MRSFHTGPWVVKLGTYLFEVLCKGVTFFICRVATIFAGSRLRWCNCGGSTGLLFGVNTIQREGIAKLFLFLTSKLVHFWSLILNIIKLDSVICPYFLQFHCLLELIIPRLLIWNKFIKHTKTIIYIIFYIWDT